MQKVMFFIKRSWIFNNLSMSFHMKILPELPPVIFFFNSFIYVWTIGKSSKYFNFISLIASSTLSVPCFVQLSSNIIIKLSMLHKYYKNKNCIFLYKLHIIFSNASTVKESIQDSIEWYDNPVYELFLHTTLS